MSDAGQDGGWWQATDGRWYPPSSGPGHVGAPFHPAYGVSGYPGHDRGRRPQRSAGPAIGLLIATGGLIGVVLLFVALHLSVSAIDRLDREHTSSRLHRQVQADRQRQKRRAATRNRQVQADPVPTVTHLGVTLTVGDPNAAGIATVLVQDAAYPVPVGVAMVAIASVRVCAGAGGSPAGAISHLFVLGFAGGGVMHDGPEDFPRLGPDACTDAEVYLEIPPGSVPVYVGFQPGPVHQYRWLLPAA